MKKLFLSLAFALMSSFAFAIATNQSKLSSDVFKTAEDVSFETKFLKDVSFGTCTVIVRTYNTDGELVGTKIHTFYNVESESDCQNWATAVRLSYSLQQ